MSDEWKDAMGFQYDRPLSTGIIIDVAKGEWYPVGGTNMSEFTGQQIAEYNRQTAEAHKEYLAEKLKNEIQEKKHLNGWVEVHTDKANHFSQGQIVYVGPKISKVEAVYDNTMLVRPLNKLETITAYINRGLKWLKRSLTSAFTQVNG